MAKQIIKGDDLMLFDSYGRSIAYATSHQLSLTADTADINSKDHGIYGGREVNKINWEITTENLFTATAFSDLFDSMMTRKPIRLIWGSKKEAGNDKTVVNGDYENWTPYFLMSGTSNATLSKMPAYYGNAYITSLSANSNTGENATFSATFSGDGKIKRITDVEELSPAIPQSGSADWDNLPIWQAYNADGSTYQAEAEEGGTLTPANGNSTETGTGTNP